MIGSIFSLPYHRVSNTHLRMGLSFTGITNIRLKVKALKKSFRTSSFAWNLFDDQNIKGRNYGKRGGRFIIAKKKGEVNIRYGSDRFRCDNTIIRDQKMNCGNELDQGRI